MAGETVRLAEYAAGLRYEDLPGEVVAAAKDASIDTIAACICGAALPWSRIVIDYAERTGPGGTSRILGLGAAKMTNAIGIAGSLAGGLLEFAKGDGGTVKRLHLGRASEAGVLAASLADAGFAGPKTVLEGQFGFLRVFCTEFDEAELTKGLGQEFVILSTVLKRYPVHATAHAAVRAVRDLQAEHGFTGGDVEAITVTGNTRMVERHAIAE